MSWIFFPNIVTCRMSHPAGEPLGPAVALVSLACLTVTRLRGPLASFKLLDSHGLRVTVGSRPARASGSVLPAPRAGRASGWTQPIREPWRCGGSDRDSEAETRIVTPSLSRAAESRVGRHWQPAGPGGGTGTVPVRDGTTSNSSNLNLNFTQWHHDRN
jgi:hypothetical protein